MPRIVSSTLDGRVNYVVRPHAYTLRDRRDRTYTIEILDDIQSPQVTPPQETPMTTSGTEIEFGTGAQEVVDYIYKNYRGTTLDDVEIIGMDHLHSYHCRCEACDLGTYWLRGQTDSSCSGEIITDVMNDNDMEEVTLPLYKIIQEAALEVDAGPNLNAGVHVHVKRNITAEEKLLCLQTWVEWEPVFTVLAQGRYNVMRPFNKSVRASMASYLKDGTYFFQDYIGEIPPESVVTPRTRSTVGQVHWEPLFQWIEQYPPSTQKNFWRAFVDTWNGVDRHSYLSINTRHNTWEVRIWNATRTAWRLELYTRLSKLIINPEFATNLKAANERPKEYNPELEFENFFCEYIPAITRAAADSGDQRCAELIERQYHYTTKVNNGEITPTENLTTL